MSASSSGKQRPKHILRALHSRSTHYIFLWTWQLIEKLTSKEPKCVHSLCPFHLIHWGNIQPDSELEDLHTHQAFQFMRCLHLNLHSCLMTPIFTETGLLPPQVCHLLLDFSQPGNILGIKSEPLSAPFSFSNEYLARAKHIGQDSTNAASRWLFHCPELSPTHRPCAKDV
jgi:hypothetical protein